MVSLNIRDFKKKKKKKGNGFHDKAKYSPEIHFFPIIGMCYFTAL